MNKLPVLGTGLTGLVGSRLVELLRDRYLFKNIGRSTGIDITNRDQIRQAVQSSDASVVLHLAAKTDVDGCEKDKILGENGEAWEVNVLATKYIVEACSESKKKLIFISTDFVFDGTKLPPNAYDETDQPNPLDWYGATKFEAEKLVLNSGATSVIARLAYPYGISSAGKKDFVSLLLSRLQRSQPIAGVSDHIMVPTYIDDVVFALERLLDKSIQGIYHVVGSQALSPYDAILRIAKTFDFNDNKIEKTTREIFFKDRAPRPFNLALNNDKIRQLGVKMKTFSEGLEEMKNNFQF